MSCQLIRYGHDGHDRFMETVKLFHTLVVRCNPGRIKADGGGQGKFDDAMRIRRGWASWFGRPPA